LEPEVDFMTRTADHLRMRFALFAISPLALVLLVGCAASEQSTNRTLVQTHFSPEEEIAPTIVNLIDHAQRTLDIAAFSFTRSEIGAATIRAHQHGVRVRLVMDTTSAGSKYSTVPDLIKSGILVRVRHKRGSQHSKYLIIDGSLVATGSYNFTLRADERNSENLLVIRDSPKVVKSFAEDYQLLLADSVAFNAASGIEK
jgi:phosphatidylserine/phosphatidylglycerophosphate/cardiolipin synthase-like enzyme